MTNRTDRNGVSSIRPSLPAGRPTLPPLPSLLMPLYVIPQRPETDLFLDERPRKKPPRKKPAAKQSEQSSNLRTSPPPKPKAGDKLAQYLWPTPKRPGS
jgi:hypothetical protein